MNYIVSLPRDQDRNTKYEKAETEKICRPEPCRMFHLCGDYRGQTAQVDAQIEDLSIDFSI